MLIWGIPGAGRTTVARVLASRLDTVVTGLRQASQVSQQRECPVGTPIIDVLDDARLGDDRHPPQERLSTNFERRKPQRTGRSQLTVAENREREPEPTSRSSVPDCRSWRPCRAATSTCRATTENVPAGLPGMGGQGRDRTGDLPLFRRTLVPTELPGRPSQGRTSWRGEPYRRRSCFPNWQLPGTEVRELRVEAQQSASPEDSDEACDATPTGLEPATSAVTGRRANQLRYGARCVAVLRFRPPTLAHEAPPTGFEPVLPP